MENTLNGGKEMTVSAAPGSLPPHTHMSILIAGHSTAPQGAWKGLGDLSHPWIKREVEVADAWCVSLEFELSGEPEVKVLSFPGDGACLLTLSMTPL